MSQQVPGASRAGKWRWVIVLVVWLCVVWGHSLMPGDLSSLESSRFVFLVRPMFNLFGNDDVRLMTLVIRKGAHFTEYAVLCALAYRAAVAWFGRTRRALVVACAVWLIAPAIDETIQLFTPGRAGVLTDVLIDMSGGLLGLVLAWACTKLREPA